MDIAEKIRQLRKQKGISQAKIAEVIGISQAAYAKIETGETKSISIEIGKGISKALDNSFNELFEIESNPKNQDQIERILSENEGLKKQIEEKTLLIETLKNERAHIKEHLIDVMMDDFSFDLSSLSILSAKPESEKEKLLIQREEVIKNFNKKKEYYIKTGFLSQSDFDDYYNDIIDHYKNLKEYETP